MVLNCSTYLVQITHTNATLKSSLLVGCILAISLFKLEHLQRRKELMISVTVPIDKRESFVRDLRRNKIALFELASSRAITIVL
jgi:hypothetical protein